MRYFVATFILLFFSQTIVAQELDGRWSGRLVMAPSGCFAVYNIEFSIQEKDGKITGTAHHFSDSLNYVRKKIIGTYSKDSNTLLIEEGEIVDFKIKEDCVPCMKSYRLTYHKGSGSTITDEQIRGSWSSPASKAADGKASCDPGTIVLNRQTKTTSTPINKSDELRDKKNILVREIRLDSSVAKIELFDNGQIDGDTVSVYVNNRSVVFKQLLRAQPITFSVPVDQKRSVQEVVMVGENLGTIPPNTALMIVTAGKERYQLYLTADEKRNALVRFVYEKGKQ
ncbi:MAG: hypothetical protein EBV71_02940 [Chitinophagia bacterium]|jgi:hypothetical protein|nr:hypothetical protein [Chitinophagia bacterium]